MRVFVYVRRRIHKLHWIREVGIWRIRILTNIWYKGGEVCVYVYIHMCVYMDVEKLNAFIYYIVWWWGATLSWYCHFIPLFFPFSVSRFFLTFSCFAVLLLSSFYNASFVYVYAWHNRAQSRPFRESFIILCIYKREDTVVEAEERKNTKNIETF